MKVFILLVLITSADGREHIQRLTDTRHTSFISCHAEKAQFKTSAHIKPFCADEKLYKRG